MTARPAQSGTSMGRVPGHGTGPDAVTADPDLALARWENEGGVPARLPDPGRDTRTAVTERDNRVLGPITTDAAG